MFALSTSTPTGIPAKRIPDILGWIKLFQNARENDYGKKLPLILTIKEIQYDGSYHFYMFLIFSLHLLSFRNDFDCVRHISTNTHRSSCDISACDWEGDKMIINHKRYSEIFRVGPYGSGRTHAICMAAKSIKAVVIAPSLADADILRDLHRVNSISIDEMSAEFKGPILFDHAAMLEICCRYEREIDRLHEETARMRVKIFNLEHPDETNQ